MGLFDKIAAPAPSVPKKGGYDFVDIPMPDGAVQRMTKSQFESQSLQDRIRVLVQGKASFFRDGQAVPSNEALKSDY
jgi:hypothetical protein